MGRRRLPPWRSWRRGRTTSRPTGRPATSRWSGTGPRRVQVVWPPASPATLSPTSSPCSLVAGTDVSEPSSGGRLLEFTVYPYEDHARLVVSLRHLRPAVGPHRRIGSVRLDIGRQDLAGLSADLAVRLVAVSILNAIAQDADRPEAPAPPDGGHGGEH